MLPNMQRDNLKLRTALSRIKLFDKGDNVEVNGANRFQMDTLFPEYEKFWQNHIVPATGRPDNIEFRPNSDRVIQKLGETSYSIFIDLFMAEEYLELVEAGDVGGHAYRNIQGVIKCTGDAIQKFKNVQDTVQGLSNRLALPIPIFSDNSTQNDWLNERAKVVEYRNAQTHNGIFATFHKVDPQVGTIYYMIDPAEVSNHYSRTTSLTWEETKVIFNSNPAVFLTAAAACIKLRDDSYRVLNNAYKFLNQALEPLWSQALYQNLWGMGHIEYEKLVPTSSTSLQTSSSSSFAPSTSGSFQSPT